MNRDGWQVCCPSFSCSFWIMSEFPIFWRETNSLWELPKQRKKRGLSPRSLLKEGHRRHYLPWKSTRRAASASVTDIHFLITSMAHHLARGFKLEKWHPMCGATTLAAQFRCKDTTFSAHEQTKERKTHFRGFGGFLSTGTLSYSSALGNALRLEILTK
jgi:hypothetical protein